MSNVRGVQEQGQEELRTMVDLGSQVYCQAEVPDTSRIFVSVGLGFHAEMTLVSERFPTARPPADSFTHSSSNNTIIQCKKTKTKIKIDFPRVHSPRLQVPSRDSPRVRTTGRGAGVRGEEAGGAEGDFEAASG